MPYFYDAGPLILQEGNNGWWPKLAACKCSPKPPPLFAKGVKNNNQLATGASKAGSGWQESANNHTTMTEGDYEQQEHTADDVGSDKEGKGGKGNGDCKEGGM